MSLKGDRLVIQTDISNICNDVVAEGQVLCFGTAGSGSALGDNAGTVTLKTNPSGAVVAGPSLAPFVSIDTTRQHRNWHRNEQLVGEHAPVLRKGWLLQNNVFGTPSLGATAYLSSSGNLDPTLSSTGGLAATPKAGQFLSKLDEDGYCKVEYDLPVL